VLHDIVPFLLGIVAPDGGADGRATELGQGDAVGGIVTQEVHPGCDLRSEKDNGLEVKDHAFVFHFVTCWWVWVVPLCLIAQSLC